MKRFILPSIIAILVIVLGALVVVFVRGRSGSGGGARPPAAATTNCATITDTEKQTACWKNKSVEAKDASRCDGIADETEQQVCVSLALGAKALANRDIQTCMSIPLEQYRGCFPLLLQYADEAYCAKLPAPFSEKCGIIVKARKK